MIAAFGGYMLLGLFAGVAAGLLGVGGGLIIVPVLVGLFAYQGFEPSVTTHLAIGSSLGTIIFTSLSSIRAHHRRGAVLWPVFRSLSGGIVIGAWLGSVIADSLSADPLRIIFALFEWFVAVQLLAGYRPRAHRAIPGRWPLAGAGVGIGTVSAVVGIGGGTLTVPFLVWHNVEMRKAVATSSACGLPIALAGTLGYVITGWGEPGLPAGSTGFVYWPAVGGVILTSILTAPVGAWLAHRLPANVLRRIFAVLLAILGASLLR
jgi:uncharacterized membrane protein YfcA